MAKTTRTFLLAAAGTALGLSCLCALPPVGGFLLGRALAAALVFPGLGQGRFAGTAVALAGFSVAMTGGAYLVFRWSGFGPSRVGVLVCWALTGGPAGMIALLAWARLQGLPFAGYARYAAAWGMATALLSCLLALAATRTTPAPGRERKRTFHPRAWVLPCLVAGWSIVWSLFLREHDLLAWLPLSLGYFDQVAVVLAAIAATSLEGALRRRLPVEGRPGRAFVLAWIALSVAPIVYAAVVAIDRGMREPLMAAPWNPAWVTEYLNDAGAALVAAPAQVAVPPLLLALAGTALQWALPWKAPTPGVPDPVRPDRRWSLLVAGAAIVLTYFCLAATSRFPVLTGREYDEETPVMLRALALLAPPDPALGRTAVVWSWAVAAVFGVAAAALVYVAVRGQLVRVFPATSYLVLTGAVALAAALAWNAGSVIGHLLAGERPLGISPATEAATFTAFVAPVFAAVLFIVHSQVGVSRFARLVELEGEQTWEKLTERYRAWKESVREHVPGGRERGLLAARAAGGALVVAVVAGTLRAFGVWSDAEVAGVFLAAPAVSFALPWPDNLTGLLYLALLAALVYAGLRKVNLRERGRSVRPAVWGFSVVAGGLAGVAGGLPGVVGLQMGLVAGALTVAVRWPASRKVLLAGGVVLVLVSAAPLLRPAPGPVVIGEGVWRGAQRRLTIDVTYPRVRGGEAVRINAALAAPLRAYVENALREHREQPGVVTGTFVVVRNDPEIVSVRYVMTGEAGAAVTYDRRAARVLTVRDVFAPAAFSPAGRRRLADALRPLVPEGQDPRTVTVDSDRLLVNLVTGGVEFTFGRDYFCVPCEPFTVRVPSGRLTGLLLR
ncbi:hypothetical protein SAMN05444920_107173 [Nonomuraea solani]|uniref:Uncharacterized protein n=1 Tax=Nonomuraea solani TaxID=1144553 RepID=A0A1H6E0T7_9ACTN|nr:hypothetical protein [Nonomuraea solani]SEG90979.1 hypothetical protein SAMN05444920_107173 [Nonomuraea solani]